MDFINPLVLRPFLSNYSLNNNFAHISVTSDDVRDVYYMFRFFYGVLNKIALIFGYNLRITKQTEHKEGRYEQALPFAMYAPWNEDALFMATYKLIKRNTLVDIYRCYELWQLINEVSDLEGAIIEIGVWRGGTGSLIAKQAEILGISSNIYLCDTFTGVVKADAHDSTYKGGEHSDTSIETVNTLLSSMGLKNTKILAGIFPDETSSIITDNKFRFCHVDVDVYQSAKDVVEWIWDKLVLGGIIVFDDYGFRGCDGITKFVNDERNKPGRIFLHNLNGHGIIIKTKT